VKDRVTGAEFRDLRGKLGLDQVVLAQVLGVHVSTIYRWEELGRRAIGMNSIQRLLVVGLVRMADSPARLAVLGARIKEELVFGGVLPALQVVVVFLCKEAA